MQLLFGINGMPAMNISMARNPTSICKNNWQSFPRVGSCS